MSTNVVTTEKKGESLESVMSWLTNVAEPAPVDPVIDTQADEVVTKLMTTDPADAQKLSLNKQAIQNLGGELQKEAARRSAMLKQPVHKLYEGATEGAPVANALVDLKMKVEELDPGQYDFEPGWATRTLGRLPFVGTPLKRYFSKYESSAAQLDAIVRALRTGKEQLNRDNITLADDQKAMRALAEKLEKAVKLGQLIDAKLSTTLERELTTGDPRRAVVETEWMFPLRQRIQDLQQQLIVNQQGIMAIDLIVRNNLELMRGVDRATNVTVSALQVAVTLALALANQRVTLEKVLAVNETTDRLIGQTAQTLRTQGAEIHKLASGTSLNIETLKQAFADVRAALDDVARFRQEALPKMAEAIVELDKLSDEAGRTIENLDNARKVGAVLNQQLGQPE
ncbi:MAG TPA: toxic anion resistance protein [Burkholderiaceae bacterium]|nr:toxic anion resistance protein [Burkholderiaceae bacterium]